MLEWSDALKICVPVAVAAIGLIGNEYFKRRWEKYKRKEEQYLGMLQSLKGFAVGANPDKARQDKTEFIQQLNVAFLYCPDSVIKAAYDFLDCVSVGAKMSESRTREALNGFVSEVRKDLHGPRRKSRFDFRLLSST